MKRLLGLALAGALFAAGLTADAQNRPFNSPTQSVQASKITGTLPVANGGTGVTTSTGSGAVVLGTSPNFTTGLTINGSTALTTFTQGTWTPTSPTVTLTANSGIYTKVGRLVHVQGTMTWPSTADGTSVVITGLPFTAHATSPGAPCTFWSTGLASVVIGVVGTNDTQINNIANPATGPGLYTNANWSTIVIRVSCMYQANT